MTDSELASLEATWRGARDLAEQMATEAEAQKRLAEECFADWQSSVYGLEAGVTHLRKTTGRHKDQRFIFAEVDRSVTFTDRPWVKAFKVKKDGKPSANTVALFSEWVVDEGRYS